MKTYKPTTPSIRQRTTVDYSSLTPTPPWKNLLKALPKKSGRNNQGRITVRHQGGGNKKLYRLVDFKQRKLGIPAKVESIEYDPFRTSFIARVVYQDGERCYILAPVNLKKGDTIIVSENAPLKEGNRLLLKNIPVGYFVYNVELQPGKGGQLARSAGISAQVVAHVPRGENQDDDGYTHLKLPSGEVRMVNWKGMASLGQLSNPEHNLINLGKAGASRHLGIRPTVRGSAMNPCDHPYGGGEGRAQRGTKRPKTKWGKVTGGRRTRNKKKWSGKLIIKRRK